MGSQVSMSAGIGRFPRSGLARMVARTRAWTRRAQLDAMLAAGRDPWSSAPLAWRAAQLASLPERRKLATGLDNVVCRADQGVPSYPRIRRQEVIGQRERLLRLAGRLREPAPMPVAAVARLALLVCSGDSPLYVRGRPAELVDAVVIGCLDALVDPAAQGS